MMWYDFLLINILIFRFNTTMAYSIHRRDVTQCGLCNLSKAKIKCMCCNVHLCLNCLVHHIDFEVERYAIVPLGPLTCDIHQTRTCTHRWSYCEACSACSLSTQHKEHIIVPTGDIDDVEQRSSSNANIPMKGDERTILPDFSTSLCFSRMMHHPLYSSTENSDSLDELKRTWSETITSEKLKVLFGSFKEELSEDPLSNSFASEILKKFLTKIKLLSNRIVLTTDIKSSQTEIIRVFEVKVASQEDQSSVVPEVRDGYFSI